MHNKHARSFFYILLAAATIAAYLFLRHYISILLFAVLLGFVFHPLYEWFEKVFSGRKWLALPSALIGILVTFIVPVGLALSLVIKVVSDFARGFAMTSFDQSTILASFVDTLNRTLAKVSSVHYVITADQVTQKVHAAAEAVRVWGMESLQGIGGTFAGILPAAFIIIYVVCAVFTNYHRISQYLHKLSPLPDSIDRMYVRRITAMATSMIRGSLVVAALQGVLTGLTLWALGVPYPAFLGLVATLFSIIPIGSWVVAIPTGLILLATGSVWQGLVLILTNVLIVSNLDNVLRPRLVSKEASLHPALVLIGLFAGLTNLGFLGLVYGPVFMVVLVTTLEVYREHLAPPEDVK